MISTLLLQMQRFLPQFVIHLSWKTLMHILFYFCTTVQFMVNLCRHAMTLTNYSFQTWVQLKRLQAQHMWVESLTQLILLFINNITVMEQLKSALTMNLLWCNGTQWLSLKTLLRLLQLIFHKAEKVLKTGSQHIFHMLLNGDIMYQNSVIPLGMMPRCLLLIRQPCYLGSKDYSLALKSPKCS